MQNEYRIIIIGLTNKVTKKNKTIKAVIPNTFTESEEKQLWTISSLEMTTLMDLPVDCKFEKLGS